MEKTKLKVLILDDEQARHDTFVHAFDALPCDVQYDLELIHALNAEEALKTFQAGKVDIFFSDHDLGYYSDDGNQLATKILMEVPEAHWPTYVVVHSANWSGARNIGSKFRGAGIQTLEQSFHSDSFVDDSDRWQPIAYNWIRNCANLGKPWEGNLHGWKQEDNG